MMYAECRADCGAVRVRFEAEYQPKYSKAVESLTARERLVTFFDFPAEQWKHLRTTNVIESRFATVCLRERATRGAGSRTKGLLMAFKLLEMAQLR
jgi:putative transposase